MNVSYFSPGEECLKAIISQINSAVSDIKICVFTISDDRITKAILERQRFGVKVRVITDNEKCFDLGSDVDELSDKGIEVKVDKTPHHMHHKFAVIDNKIVLTGSYNWTRSAAENNYENIVVSDDKQLVRRFVKEFDKLWECMAEYE